MSGFALPEGWDERPEIEINLSGFAALGRENPAPDLSATIKCNDQRESDALRSTADSGEIARFGETGSA
jgi:hypothetical protein